jgi:two-component system invasion response regulator UvrY
MMSDKKISILLLDEHADFRDCLVHWLDSKPDIDVVGSVSDPGELSQLLDAVQVDVVLMGFVFSNDNGLGLIADWSTRYPQAGLLVLSHLPEESYAQRVISVGARGYLMKTVTPLGLLNAIRKVAAGQVAVSPRMASRLFSEQDLSQLSTTESRALALIRQKKNGAAIASELRMSEQDVATLKQRISTKLSHQLRRNSRELLTEGFLWRSELF